MATITFLEGQSLSATQLNNAFAQKVDVAGDASTSTVLSTGSSVPRALKDRFKDVVNVLDFLTPGTPDGIADNTAQLQAALNAAVGKARVYFPRTVNPYSVTGLSVLANSHLIIDGTVQLRASSNGSVFKIAPGASNIVLEGHGTIDGNKSAQTIGKHGIEASSANVIHVRGLTIQNCFNSPVSFTSGSQIYLHDLVLQNSTNAPTMLAIGNACVSDCYIYNIPDTGFLLYGGSSNIELSGNNISLCADGIGLFNDANETAFCHDVTIADNFIYNNSGNGINLHQGSGGSGNHQHVVIRGNRLNGNNTANVVNQGSINSATASYVTITGNDISKDGIGANGAVSINVAGSDTVVVGNQIINPGIGSTVGIAINLANSAANVLVTDNNIVDDQTVHTMSHGIAGNCGTHARIIDNSIVGSIGLAIAVTKVSDTVLIDGSSNTYTVQAAFATTGAICDQSTVVTTPVTGFNTTIPNGVSSYLMMPAAALASGTLVMPLAPLQGQVLRIMTTQDVSSFTLSPNTGQTISSAPNASVFASNSTLLYFYNGAEWFLENASSNSSLSGNIQSVRVVTASGGVTVGANDRYVMINKTAGEATAVTLPSSPTTGRIVSIKDAKGDAGTNHITISGATNIDGAASFVLNINFESVDLIWNGVNWSVI